MLDMDMATQTRCARCLAKAARGDFSRCANCKLRANGYYRARAERLAAEGMCKHCGERPATVGRTGKRVTCDECRAKQTGYAASSQKRGEPKLCPTCGDEFRHKSNRYCSKECSVIGQTGEANSRWKGGSVNGNGYVVVRVDAKYKLQHRWVMEQHLGRPLERWEYIHHVNGDKTDNRVENLEIWIKGHPSGQRPADLPPHCPTCTCYEHSQPR